MEITPEILEKKALLARHLQNKHAREGLYQWLKTELAYTSNAIEGSTLTRQETVLAISENITGKSKPITDYIAALNHAKAFAYVWAQVGKKKVIDVSTVLAIHERILAGIDDDHAGCYRQVAVRISGSRVVLPNPLKVAELMQQFNEWLVAAPTDNIVVKAIEAHYRLVAIHPFSDGNGRTARLLMNLILMRDGFAPIIIRKMDRRRYLNALEIYHTKGEAEPYYKFMFSCLHRSLKIILDILDTFKPTANYRQLMTIGKFAKHVGLPVSTIRYWVQIEKLKPAFYSDEGYMLFLPDQEVPSSDKIDKKKD